MIAIEQGTPADSIDFALLRRNLDRIGIPGPLRVAISTGDSSTKTPPCLFQRTLCKSIC